MRAFKPTRLAKVILILAFIGSLAAGIIGLQGITFQDIRVDFNFPFLAWLFLLVFVAVGSTFVLGFVAVFTWLWTSLTESTGLWPDFLSRVFGIDSPADFWAFAGVLCIAIGLGYFFAAFLGDDVLFVIALFLLVNGIAVVLGSQVGRTIIARARRTEDTR